VNVGRRGGGTEFDFEGRYGRVIIGDVVGLALSVRSDRGTVVIREVD
jgi:hypothetical protein